MPGPQASSSGLSEAAYIKLRNTISHLSSYEAATQICRYLKIPNAKHRRGLRKVHACLGAIAGNLCRVFDFACARRERRICDVVAGIWVELCTDAVLCRGLLEEGLLPRTQRLVELDGSPMLLPLLSLLARHGDDAVKTAVLQGLASVFANWTVPWRSYEYSNEHALVIFAHCIGATRSASAQPELPAGLSVGLVADLALRTLEDPAVSYESVIHALPLLIVCAQTCPASETETRSRILDFLAVLLHSRDIGLRFVSSWVFCGLAALEQGSPSRSHRSPRSVEYGHLPEIASCDVPDGSEQGLIRANADMLRVLVRELLDDGDYYTFGAGMACVLLNGPFVFHRDDFPDFEGTHLAGLDTWYSLLPPAIEALRYHAERAHLDSADILAMEHHARVGTSEATAAYAREVLRRNPTHSYAYVMLSEHSEDLEEALQAARNGLRLPVHLPAYLQRQLQVAASGLSFAKAQTLLLQTGPTDWRGRKAGMDLIHQMAHDIRAFMEAAPSDTRDLLLPMLDLNISYLLLFQGTDAPGLEKIMPHWHRIEEQIETLTRQGIEVPTEGAMRVGNMTLAHHCSQGFSKWVAVVERFDELDKQYRAHCYHNQNPHGPGSTAEPHQSCSRAGYEGSEEDVFDRWWEPGNEATLESLLRGPLRCHCHNYASVQLSPGLPVMYACSWCSCRTAIVRKCSRCQGAWYCDSQCQRAHWPQHRVECRAQYDT